MYHVCPFSLVSQTLADLLADRDCAIALGWVHTLLTTAILNLPETLASMGVKIEAVAAINKVDINDAIPSTLAEALSRLFGYRMTYSPGITSMNESPRLDFSILQ
jgi:hypothetical protein